MLVRRGGAGHGVHDPGRMIDFSIVIPTKARPDTFAHALASARAQDDPGVEIVVQNNGADPATRALVEAAGDARIRYEETDAVLPMSANWERALRRTAGAWITVIGDDDAILPDACAYLRAWLAERPAVEVVHWRPVDYGWPSMPVPGLRNRLLLHALSHAAESRRLPSKLTLAKLYAQDLDFIELPMIYNSAVHRRVVERAWAGGGRYFATALPDVHSGVANLWLTEIFDKIGRPLTVSGASQHSTGAAYAHPRFDQANRSEFEALNRTAGAAWHPDLFPSTTQEIVIANDLLASKAVLFPDEAAFVLSLPGLAQTIRRSLHRSPDSYPGMVADLIRLAERHGLTDLLAELPPAPTEASVLPPGLWSLPGMAPILVVDCAKAGVANVADAARLTWAMLPPWRAED